MEIITVILKAIGVLFCCCLVFAAGIAIWLLIVELGKRELKRKNEYYVHYVTIQGYIRDSPVTLVYHDAILIMLNKLKELKHKDREKTSVLTNEFNWRYRTIAKQRTTCKSSAEAAFKS